MFMDSSVSVQRADNSAEYVLEESVDWRLLSHITGVLPTQIMMPVRVFFIVMSMISVIKNSCFQDRSIWGLKTWVNLICFFRVILKEVRDEQAKIWFQAFKFHGVGINYYLFRR